MVRNRLAAALAILAMAAACAKPADKAAASRPEDPAFHDKVVAYLADHPGVIQEGINAYTERQNALVVKKASAAIALHRSQLDADARDFVANPDGKITVVEFFDYRCPYCKADHAALQNLIASDKDIRFVFKEYPIIPDQDGKIGVSLRAAEAALTAKRAGKYLQVHDAMMTAPDLDDATIARILHDNGLAPAEGAPLSEALDQIQATRQLGLDINAAGTPTFIVAGALVSPTSLPQLAAAIEKARQDAKGQSSKG